MKFILFLLCIFLLLPAVSFPADLMTPVEKIVNTSWIEQATLKYGLLTSMCAAQGFTGLTEGYHWTDRSGIGEHHLVNDGNYHAYETLRRLSWISTGWFAYGNIRDANIRWYQKIFRFTGAALISRNAFEWSYKTQRYGNPFDYTEDHNKSAVVYFGFRNGHITDLYFSTGPVSGPLVDIACLAGGLLLFK